MTDLSEQIFEALEDLPRVYETAIELDLDEDYIAFNETELIPLDSDDYYDHVVHRVEFNIVVTSDRAELDRLSTTIRERLDEINMTWLGSERFAVRQPKLSLYLEQMRFEKTMEE